VRAEKLLLCQPTATAERWYRRATSRHGDSVKFALQEQALLHGSCGQITVTAGATVNGFQDPPKVGVMGLLAGSANKINALIKTPGAMRRT
jgi:hypothetical protein